MSRAQPPFLVGGILILAAMAVGILLGRAGKPYGTVKLIIHLFLFAWFSVGFAFIVYGVAIANVTKVIWIPVAVMGLMILTQLFTGALMLASKKTPPVIHLSSAILMILSDACAFIIAGLHP
jgi:hypothetical protein